MTSGNDEIVGDGNMPTALIDLRDVGRYMARIISDPRTLNRKIFAHNVVSTQNKIHELMEELSEESIVRNYVCCRAPSAQISEQDLQICLLPTADSRGDDLQQNGEDATS